MAIPKEILAIKRPVNTVVVRYGKNGDRYGVRKRIGCKRVNGRNLPVTGPTIGHIRNGVYVAIADERPEEEKSGGVIELKDWAAVVLADNVFKGVLFDLREFYPEDEAVRLYCIAILRVCYPGTKDYELKELYEGSFLSELYPGVALSKNTVSSFWKNLGKSYGRIIRFMRRRAEAICPNHHVLIDGTLKSDESKVNSLSDFSRKARLKGSRDISVLYAFDLDIGEPVCSQCYPGNMLDITAYEDFVSTCGVKRGVIVSDKGIPASAAEAHFRANPDLHYLNPIKRNAKFINTHSMYDFEGVLSDRDGIQYKKAKVKGKNKFLYSFRDAALAANEEKAYLAKAKKDGTYDNKAYLEERQSFGTVVFESDLDLKPEMVYKMYEERWEIEVVMRYYKSSCEFDETRVHNDYSVYGSEFCDFLSTVLTFRLIKAFDKAELMKKMTYSRIVDLLVRAKKIRIDDGEWRLVKINPSLEMMLQRLDLLPRPDELPKRKPGRPKKSEPVIR